MASCFLGGDDNILSQGPDDDWFDAAPTSVAPASSAVPNVVITAPKGPRNDAVKSAMTSAAWKDWCRPLASQAAPAAKLSSKERKEVDQHAASAFYEMKKAQGEQEMEVAKMASASKAALELTKANAMLRKTGVRIHVPVTDGPGKAEGKQPKNASPEASGAKESPPTKEPNAKRIPPAEESIAKQAESEQPAAKKRKAKGEAGTFAGNRPPSDPDAAEIFALKKELFAQSKHQLMQKYPGKALQIGKSANQFAYWKHVREHLRQKFTKMKGANKPSQAMVKAELRAASEAWSTSIKQQLGQNSSGTK